MQQQHTVCDFSGSDSWVILSPIEQSIKHKIESVGTPLKDWDIQINYGIKTGYNVAFIISTAKRNEILSNTADYVAGQAEKYYAPAGEYARTAALIRRNMIYYLVFQTTYYWSFCGLLFVCH